MAHRRKLSVKKLNCYISLSHLEYPQHLHDVHNEIPFCAERQQLPDEAFKIIGLVREYHEKLLLSMFITEQKNLIKYYLPSSLSNGNHLTNIDVCSSYH